MYAVCWFWLRSRSVHWLQSHYILRSHTPYPSVLDFWKIMLEKLSLTNWIFSLFRNGFLLQNQFWNWFLKVKNQVPQTRFFKLDFSNIKYRRIGREYLGNKAVIKPRYSSQYAYQRDDILKEKDFRNMRCVGFGPGPGLSVDSKPKVITSSAHKETMDAKLF